MALDGSVTLPAFGTVKKKTAAEAAAGAVVLVLAVYWWRQRQAASAAASSPAAAGTVTDPAGNTCAAINPATGYCPGTPEDQQALSGTLSPGSAGGSYDTSGLGVGLQGAYYGSGGAVQQTAPGPGNFADNAEWAQYAETYLINSAGGDPATVGNAIGKYLTGQPVTTDQVQIIDEAIAYAGQPPQPGPGGDPPGINTTAGSTGTASASAGAGPAPGSSSSSSKAAPAGSISNLQASHVTKSSFTARWNPAHGATEGYAYVLSQLNGTIVKHGTTRSTSVSFSGLHPGWTYNLGVQGLPGGPGDNIHVPLPSK